MQHSLLKPGSVAHPWRVLQQVQDRNVVAAAKKQQQPKKRPKQRPPLMRRPGDGGQTVYDEDTGGAKEIVVVEPVGNSVPTAPDVAARPQTDDGPSYRVFMPEPSNLKEVRDAPWSWGDDGTPSSSAPLPEWNPRSGFMKTAAQARAEQPQPQPQQQQQPPQRPGGSASSFGLPVSAPPPPEAATSAPPKPGTATSAAGLPPATAAPATASGRPAVAAPSKAEGGASAGPGSEASAAAQAAVQALPPATRAQVVQSCVGTSFWMVVFAFCIRSYAQSYAPQVLGTDPAALEELLRLPSGLGGATELGLTVGTVALVTGMRLLLMKVWPDFSDATLRSNQQVLAPLGWPDVALVALLSGVSEELLFRGAIIPATLPDWRGVLLAGAIFGALHNSGGRNIAFAAWATAVGCLYGGVFLYTHNIWVPAAAHVFANFASAAVWKSQQPTKEA